MADEMINPCPFCGSDAAYSEADWAVCCDDCNTIGPQSLELPDKSGAIAAWNGAGRWISVEDDTPEQGQYVLAYIARTVTEVIWAGLPVAKATHWQPLPPPPVCTPSPVAACPTRHHAKPRP